ncbi:MAG: flagellar type III secretion system protein FlhB, partial [Pseudomonadota bacterium]
HLPWEMEGTIPRDVLEASAALGMAGLILVAAAVLGNIVQQMPVLSTEKMQPKLSKLSLIQGAKRLFGAQGLVNFLKGVFKLAIVSVILVAVLWPERDALAALVTLDLAMVLPFAKDLAVRMMACVLAAMTAIAALDYAYQRWEYMKRQRMTKQEVKDEFKQSEGDPAVKAKIRQVRQERSRQRMMAAVPEASVVVTNPTHYAVALKYEHGQAGAPVCLAKGVDSLALRIRETAEEHDVPIVENPPLARALYGSVEIEEEIPIEHYKAVAEVIGYVMRKAKGVGARR